MKKAILCGALTAAAIAALPAAAAAPSVSGLDKQYLTTSLSGDKFEIAGGKLALKKGQSAQVKALAQTLIKDHSKSLKEGTTLAHKLGIPVPPSATPSMQWELQVVSSFSGAAFDKWYAGLETKDHQQDISEASDEVKDGSNPQVRASAKKEIPTLKKHLKMSQQALKAAAGE